MHPYSCMKNLWKRVSVRRREKQKKAQRKHLEDSELEEDLLLEEEILTLSNKISDFYLHVFFPVQFHTVKLDLNNPFHLGNHMELGNWVRIVTWDDDVWLWSKLILYSGETWHDGKRSSSSSIETGLTVHKFIIITSNKKDFSWTFQGIFVGNNSSRKWLISRKLSAYSLVWLQMELGFVTIFILKVYILSGILRFN